jgi:hypothetical protein
MPPPRKTTWLTLLHVLWGRGQAGWLSARTTRHSNGGVGSVLIPHAVFWPCEWRARLLKRRQKYAAAGRALLGPPLPRLNLGYAQWLASFKAGIEESVELVVSSLMLNRDEYGISFYVRRGLASVQSVLPRQFADVEPSNDA